MHIMLDLESGSTEPNAAVFQCAAVPFSLERDGRVMDVSAAFNVYFADTQGLVDPDTIKWWNQQGQAYNDLVKGIARSLFSEKAALQLFIDWYKLTEKYVGLIEGIWSHGAAFDIPVMKMAFQRHSLKYPWKYSIERCTRTMHDRFGHVELPFEGTVHNALSDAVHQIKKLWTIL